MLLNSVILLLREVLEAAVLVSVLLALSSLLRLGWHWLLLALPVAVMGTIGFAATLAQVTDALAGAGQEVSNALLQGGVYLLIVLIMANTPPLVSAQRIAGNGLRILMAGAVTCAMIREGSEIVIYVVGFASSEEHRTAVFAGSAIGAGIGVSLGVLLYYTLKALAPQRAYRACLVLLCFIGAGMVMQAAMLLEQVDWLPSGKPLWDSSALVSEQSVTGELLYAVFGYEASPSGVQVALYLLSMVVLVAAYGLGRRKGRRADEVA